MQRLLLRRYDHHNNSLLNNSQFIRSKNKKKGITQKKNQLTILITSGLSIAVVAFQWFFWGYSLALSETGSSFIGDLSKQNFSLVINIDYRLKIFKLKKPKDHFALRKVGNHPHPLAPSIPSNAYVIIQKILNPFSIKILKILSYIDVIPGHVCCHNSMFSLW